MLEIMQKAVVPWSNVVEKLVQQYLEMDGPKYVSTGCRLIEIVTILSVSTVHNFSSIAQTRTFKGELPSDGDKETFEELRDPQLQPLQQHSNYGNLNGMIYVQSELCCVSI